MVDGTMEFISSVLKGTPIQPMYHNKKKAAKYTISTILHTVFSKKNFKLPDTNHSTLSIPFLKFGTHFVYMFSNFLLLHILRYIAVKPGAINSGLEKNF